VYSVAEEEIGLNIRELAASSGVWGESATGVTFGGLKAAVAAGELGPTDTVVLLVTGDGLKTPQLVAETCEPLEIDADADALLDRLGVAVS
jgi:threonine synthase